MREELRPTDPFALSPAAQDELLALARMLRRAAGSFVLGFARCNVVPLRQRLVAVLQEALAVEGISVHELELSAETEDIPGALAAAPGDGEPLFIYGLAKTISSGEPDRVLAQLNERRPVYQRLERPLVFWLPEYALELVARQTPDFWAWRSGVYEFALLEAEQEALVEREVRAVDWTTQWNLDRAAREARLHLLRGLLEEYTGGSEQAQRARAETLRRLADLEGTVVSYDLAERRLQEALETYEALGDRREVAVTQGQLADVHRLRGEYEEAERLYREALETKEALGDRREVAVTLHDLALFSVEQGRPEEALRLLSRSRDLFAALGLSEDVAEEEELITQIRQALESQPAS